MRAATTRRRAFKLRLEGHTFLQIGRALGVSTTTAHAYVNAVWDRLDRQTDRLARQLRRKEVREMDVLLKQLMPIATRDNLRPLDPAQGPGGPMVVSEAALEEQFAAIDKVLRIIQRRCEIFGLIEPQEDEDTDLLEPAADLAETRPV